MKHLIRHSFGAALLSAAVCASLHAEPTASGAVDFGKFSPSASGREFVEVNIGSNIISMVARLGKGSEPEIADALQGLQGIHVNVIGLDDSNRAELQKRVKKVREELDGKGWERIVTVQEKDEDVAVQVKTRGQEAIQGVVVTVLDGDKEAVLVNIVGDIKPEKLAIIGERFDIEPLKKIGLAHKKQQ